MANFCEDENVLDVRKKSQKFGFFVYFISVAVQSWGHMTDISSFALINEFFLRGATERNTR